MTKLTKIFVFALAGFLVSGTPAVAGEKDAAALSSLEHMDTGIGIDEREGQYLGFQAKLVFANIKGEYLANVTVRIRKGDQERVIHSEGPWFLLRGQPGTYEVTAQSGELEASRTIVLPRKGLRGYLLHLRPVKKTPATKKVPGV